MAEDGKPTESRMEPAPNTAQSCPLSIDQIAAADSKSALRDVRLVDAEVTPEAIARLAGKHWGTVTLVSAKLDGTILEPLSRAASIHTLRLFGGAGLNGQIPRLQHVKRLRGLEIQAPLTGYSVEAIAALTQLEELGLPQELTINVSGARELAKLVNLKSLRLYLVNIDDASFVELRPLVRLERLDLTHTRITDKGLRTIENMPHLKTLELDRDWFYKEQLTDAGLPSILRLSELEALSLSGKITNVGLVQVAKLPKLKSLGIFHTEIGGSGLGALENSSVENLMAGAGQIDSEPALTSLKKCRAFKSMLIYGGGMLYLAGPTGRKAATGTAKCIRHEDQPLIAGRWTVNQTTGRLL